MTGSGPRGGVEVYPNIANYEYDYETETWSVSSGAKLTVESGSVTGIASGAEEMPMVMAAAEVDEYEEEDEAEEVDFIMSAGVYVGPECTLAVNGGTVTGINENQDLEGLNPGIAFADDTATLTVGEGVKVLDDAGNDITEAAVADPTVLNEYPEATITAKEEAPVIVIPTVASSLKQSIESEIKDADGNDIDGFVRVDFYENHVFRVTARTSSYFFVMGGKYDVKDGKLVFTLKNGTELKFEDNVLVVPLPNGHVVSAKLDQEVIDLLMESF